MNKKDRPVYDCNYLLESSKVTNEIKQHSYKLLGNIKSKKVLDLGCGIGTDLLQLTRYVGKYGEVTGIDKNKNLLKEAEINLAKTNFNNVKLVHADAKCIPFENGYFDAIRVERVFQHLDKPLEVMQEVNRVLKYKGQLVILETDWASLSIFSKNYELEKKVVDYLMFKYIANGLASRLLDAYLNRAYFKKINLKIFPSIINSYKMTNEFIKLEDIITKLIKKDDNKKDWYLEWLNEIRKSDLKGNFRCLINMFMISSIKNN